jgi:hypothetical protein
MSWNRRPGKLPGARQDGRKLHAPALLCELRRMGRSTAGYTAHRPPTPQPPVANSSVAHFHLFIATCPFRA